MQHNPYSKASDAYGKSSTAAPDDQRTLEGQALMKAALKLEFLKKRFTEEDNVPLEEMDDILDYNRKLWTVFAGETVNEDHELPQDLRNNIASLAVFIFKRTIDIQSEPTPDKFDVMIDINRQIAAGLLKQPTSSQEKTSAVEAEKQTTEQPAPKENSSPETKAPSKNNEDALDSMA